MDSYDIIVIGAGMAGASVTAELADHGARVLLLERESQPGYHTTGRSAALYSQSYGPPAIRALTRASDAYLRDPASAFAPHPLLRQRDVVYIARADQDAALRKLRAELGDAVETMDPATLQDRVPLLRPGYAAQALREGSAADIDVDALHQLYLRRLRAANGVLHTGAELRGLSRANGVWQVDTGTARHAAPVIVNAAGAWADEVARMAGVATIGLTPKRRTALLISPPQDCDIEDWPMIIDADEEFYAKPDAGKLLISPADETPSPPCDAQPDELDVAIAVDRFETAFDMQVRRIDHKWAGLRTFVADKSPVAGFAPEAEGFFWLAGQGGYGIQSAPALARAAAALIQGRDLPADITAQGITAAMLSPTRAALTS